MKKVKILAIDDNNDNLVVLKALIKEAFPEAEFISANSGSQGIRLGLAERPDVILTDVVMPGMDGYEVCETFKENEFTHTIPVIMITAASTNKESRIKALEAGADAFLTKPVDEQELTAQIRAMVRIKESEDRKIDEKERLEKLVEERTNELLHSQAQLKGIFENLQDSYFQADLSGKFAMVSPSALKMYGYSSLDELLGQSAEQLYFNPKERNSIISMLRTEGQIKDYVSQGRKKDGSAFWVSMNIQWLWSKDRQIIGTEGMVRDITERIKAEKALHESEEKYRLMVDLLPDAVIIHEGGKFVFANAAAIKTVGADSFEQLIERSLLDYVHPDYRTFSLNRIKEIYSNGQPSTFSEEKFITLKDEIIDVEVIGIPVMYMGKRAIQTIFRDITERKRAEKKLIQSEEKYRMFIDLAADGFFHGNEVGKFIDVNISAVELTGYSREELLTMNIKDLFSTDSNKSKPLRYDLLNNGATIKAERELVRKDGRIIFVDMNSKQMPDGSYQSFIRDVTDRKQANEALKNSLSLTEATLESIHNGILVVDHEGRVIKTSSRFAVMWQIPEDILGSGDDKSLMNYILDQLIDPDEFVAKVKELYANPEAESTDLIYFTDGRIFERVSKPMTLEGKPTGRVWSFLDITERKRAEVALKESQSLYYSLIEQLPSPVFRKDREGRFILVNSQFCTIKGLSSEHFIGFTASEVAANEITVQGKIGHATQYFAQGEDVHEQIIQTGKTFVKEEEYIFSDGSKQFLHVVRMPVVDSSNNIIGSQGIMFDITDRKLAEEARKESFEFNRSLLKTIPFGMDIVDEYGNILFQNDNFENVFGKNAIGGKCWELYRDDKSQCIDCPLHKGIGVGETATYESAGVLGGRIFEISHTGMMFKGKKAMLEIFQDITDRKLAEVELRKAKKLLEQTFEQSPVPMVLVSMPDMMIRIVNPASQSFLGINDAASVINTPLKEINPTWQDYDMNGKQTDFEDLPLPKSLVGKQTIGEERQIVRKDGTMRYELANSFPIYNDQNEIIAGTLFMTDITKQKQSQEAAFESVKLFKDLFNASPDAIILIDINHPTTIWPIVDCNEAACAMNGYTREEMIGQSIDLLHVKKTTQEEHGAYFNDLKEKGILHRENIHRHKDGHIFPVESSTSIVTIGGQEMVLGIDRDITERKQSELELILAKDKAQESDRLKSAFLANMSHEIRTPLNSIIGFSELILDPDFDNEQTTTFAEIIYSNGNSLLSIITDIMDISKLESGQFKLDIKTVSVQNLLNNLQKDFSLKVNEKGLDFMLDFSEIKGDLNFETDENKLKQILRNFIVNAIKFTEKGFVEAGVKIVDEYLQFRIKDTGIGIPEEYHKRIFERFIQVESPDSRKHGGNGLGLAISKSLIEALGGRVWLESEPGVGSTFYFTVPKKKFFFNHAYKR